MSIGVVDRKMLWGRAANFCAYPGCNQRLTADLKSPESAVLAEHGAVLGEEAHIRSSKVDGPRHDPSYPIAEVDTYQNLMLLCPTHHLVIDKSDGAAYSVEDLLTIKREHEAAIDSKLAPTQRINQALAEVVTASVTVWETKTPLSRWGVFTSNLNAPIPRITSDDLDELADLGGWLLSRNWPSVYPKLAYAFENLRIVLGCLISHSHTSMDAKDGKWIEQLREYRASGLRPDERASLVHKFNVDRYATSWITGELTRAVNLVYTAIRDELDPFYRFSEGVLLMAMGDGIFVSALLRLEYDSVDWLSTPGGLSASEVVLAIEVELGSSDILSDPMSVYDIEVSRQK